MLTPPTPTTKELSGKVLRKADGDAAVAAPNTALSPDEAKVPSIVILILPMFCLIILLEVSKVSTSTNEVCEQVEQEVCQEVQETVYQEQTVQQCEPVTEQQCGTVPERECRAVSTPTQTTEYQQQCSTVSEKVCPDVSETNCPDVETPVQVLSIKLFVTKASVMNFPVLSGECS